MTSTERAKAFLRDKVKKTALIILPLAAAAVQAHAGAIGTPLSFSFNSGFFGTSGAASGSIFNTSLGGSPFTNGITLYGGGSYLLFGSGFGTGATCGDICFGFAANGSGSGTFLSDSFPITYDFTLSDSNGAPLHWSLYARFNDNTLFASTEGLTPEGGGEVQGTFYMTGLSGQNLSNWVVGMDIDFGNGSQYFSNESVTIDIPAETSIDLGTQSVPEPGTGWMLAGAGALVAAFRRRLFRR